MWFIRKRPKPIVERTSDDQPLPQKPMIFSKDKLPVSIESGCIIVSDDITPEHLEKLRSSE